MARPTRRISRRSRTSRSRTPDRPRCPQALEVRNGELKMPRPRQRRVIGIANQKGGVGKTTTTVNIGVALAFAGLNVLVVDLDPQGTRARRWASNARVGTPSIYDVLLDEISAAEAIQVCPDAPRLGCIPATIDLAGAEIELVSMVARETRLKKALDAIDGEYDYILIDCPPSLGLLTVNAMVATERGPHPDPVRVLRAGGAGPAAEQHRDGQVAPQPATGGQHHPADHVRRPDETRRPGSGRGPQALRPKVLDVVIPRSVKVSEAPGFSQSVMTYDPDPAAQQPISKPPRKSPCAARRRPDDQGQGRTRAWSRRTDPDRTGDDHRLRRADERGSVRSEEDGAAPAELSARRRTARSQAPLAGSHRFQVEHRGERSRRTAPLPEVVHRSIDPTRAIRGRCSTRTRWSSSSTPSASSACCSRSWSGRRASATSWSWASGGWRAAERAGLIAVPAIVRRVQDADLLRDALLENIHRANLNPLEEAAAYQQLLEEFDVTHEELAGRLGRSRPVISNTIRLLKLPVPVQRRVAAGVLSAGHARALLALDDPPPRRTWPPGSSPRGCRSGAPRRR